METVFSGIQPTGTLHIGNYLGAIRNWVAMSAEYRCFYCIVDLHAMTQDYLPAEMSPRILDLTADLVGCGLDPDSVTLYVQSHVPEHAELAWILSTVTPHGDAARMTQFKDKSQKQPENVNVGLFTYPILQAADILLYRATRVPVGADQIQHLELAREIARKFNARFPRPGAAADSPEAAVLLEPQPIMAPVSKVLSLDGAGKMSKSNPDQCIFLRDPEDVIRGKLKPAMTDPARVRRKDPGEPDKCNIGTLHKVFSTPEVDAHIRHGCRTAEIGCIDCKKLLGDAMVETLGPIRERALALRADEPRLRAILAEGARKARLAAQATMAEVRRATGLEL
jgi:tryptophanyl-tRNA synthetase